MNTPIRAGSRAWLHKFVIVSANRSSGRTQMTRFSAALALFGAALFAVHAQANAFVGWQVANVPWGDTLNIRKFPSNGSQKQAAYPNGTVLQMTGTCTGSVDLFDIEHLPPWKQAERVRYRWCQVWHDPAQSGHFVSGWVYGKYITPY